MKYFITAIGTDSGKTLISSILCEALGFDYWKPVQSGDDRDTVKVKELVSSDISFIPEQFLLKTPESPHAAAEKDGVNISISDFELPKAENLIIEGAGGLMVPLNDEELILDLIKKLNVPVILVSNTYLGSINHTLLSYNALKSYGIEVVGLVFNGPENKDTESVIIKMTKLSVLFRVPQFDVVNKEQVSSFAQTIKKELNEKLR